MTNTIISSLTGLFIGAGLTLTLRIAYTRRNK